LLAALARLSLALTSFEGVAQQAMPPAQSAALATD